MNHSLRVSLTLLLLALSLAPALTITAALSWGIFQRERAHVLDLQAQASGQAALLLTTFLAEAEAEFLGLVESPSLREGSDATREFFLNNALFYRDTFDAFAFLDPDGIERAQASRENRGALAAFQLRSNAALFLEPPGRASIVYGDVIVDPASGDASLVIAAPIFSSVGHINGILLGSLRLDPVFAQIGDLSLGQQGTLMVTDASGRLLAHPDTARLDTIPPVPSADGVATGVSGVPVLQMRRPVTIDTLVLTIAAELPLAEADADLRRALITAGLLLFGILALATTLCVMTVNRVVRPIGTLAAASRELSTGHLGSTVAVTRHDEIGVLQRDFNQMVADLAAQRAAIEKHTNALQESLDRQRELFSTVEQLSTPLLPVWPDTVVLPIIGHVDEQRGEALTRTLVEGVAQRRARVAILDITGLATVNETIITTLLRAAQTVELLGARVILAGVSATVAPRIVASEISLGAIESYRDLQSAIEAAIG